MAKRFFYICAGIFLLALAYHLGAQNATAQSAAVGHIKEIRPANDPKGDVFYVTTDGDDIYALSRSAAPSEAHGTGWTKYRLGILR